MSMAGKTLVAALIGFVLSSGPLVAQAAPGSPPAPPTAGAPAAPSGPKAPARTFHGLELGMDRDAAIAALKADPIFTYDGPEDLSLLPSPNQSLIEVAGLSFVRRGYFQFYDGKLWVMILEDRKSVVEERVLMPV